MCAAEIAPPPFTSTQTQQAAHLQCTCKLATRPHAPSAFHPPPLPLQGDESRHSELRGQVCGLMRERGDDFAPFVEDDLTLDAHLARMRKEGVWAGHMELQVGRVWGRVGWLCGVVWCKHPGCGSARV